MHDEERKTLVQFAEEVLAMLTIISKSFYGQNAFSTLSTVLRRESESEGDLGREEQRVCCSSTPPFCCYLPASCSKTSSLFDTQA